MTPSEKPFGDLKKFGVFGGSFNPVHVGHISIAQQVCTSMKLERVVLLPAATPPHKQDAPEMGSPTDRLAMCRLAVGHMRGLAVSDYELTRGGISYTIDTARALRKAYGASAEIRFLIGSDSLPELPTWKDIDELVEITDFAIANRNNTPLSEAVWEKIDRRLGSIAEKKLRAGVVIIAPVDVSSTDIRERVRTGASLQGHLRGVVEEYIKSHRLYHWRVQSSSS